MKSDGLTPYPIFRQSLCPLLQPCANEDQVCVCFVSTMPCPAHVAKFWLCKSDCRHSETSCRELHASGLQTGGNMSVPDWGCRVDGVTISSHILWWLPKSSNLCVALRCHAEARFVLDSCSAKFFWNASCVLSAHWCRIGLSPLLALYIHRNHSFTGPEDSNHNLCPWWRLYEFVLQGTCGWCHSIDYSFVSHAKWWTQVSSAVTVWDRKASPSASKHCNNLEELLFSQFCVWLWGSE